MVGRGGSLLVLPGSLSGSWLHDSPEMTPETVSLAVGTAKSNGEELLRLFGLPYQYGTLFVTCVICVQALSRRRSASVGSQHVNGLAL